MVDRMNGEPLPPPMARPIRARSQAALRHGLGKWLTRNQLLDRPIRGPPSRPTIHRLFTRIVLCRRPPFDTSRQLRRSPAPVRCRSDFARQQARVVALCVAGQRLGPFRGVSVRTVASVRPPRTGGTEAPLTPGRSGRAIGDRPSLGRVSPWPLVADRPRRKRHAQPEQVERMEKGYANKCPAPGQPIDPQRYCHANDTSPRPDPRLSVGRIDL